MATLDVSEVPCFLQVRSLLITHWRPIPKSGDLQLIMASIIANTITITTDEAVTIASPLLKHK